MNKFFLLVVLSGFINLAHAGQCVVSGLQQIWCQCGGKDWKQGTQCQGGCTCTKKDEYYSQCIPPGGQSECSPGSGAAQDAASGSGGGATQANQAQAASPAGSGTPSGSGGAGLQQLPVDANGKPRFNAKYTVQGDNGERYNVAQNETTPGPLGNTPGGSRPECNGGFSCLDAGVIGCDVCGNGGCKTKEQYCQAVAAYRQDPCCTGGNGATPGGNGAAPGGPAVSAPSGTQPSGVPSTPSGVPSTPSGSGLPPVTGGGGGEASTTSYSVGGQDSCGCDGGWLAPNGGKVLTAATNYPLFDIPEGDNSGYCEGGCGKCFQLTKVDGGDSVVVLITNLCPVRGNEQWCKSPNSAGKSYHFDIAIPAGADGSAGQNGWGNTVVNFAKVSCSLAQPLLGSYQSCKCAAQRPAQV